MKKAYFYGGTAIFLWSTIAASTKLMLGSLDSMQILSITMLFAAVFLLLVNLLNGKLKQMKRYSLRDYLYMLTLGILGLFLYNLFLYIGIDSMRASQAFIINYLWPIMTVIFACVILKEPMTVRKAIAIGMSFLGVVIVTSDGGLGGISRGELTGALCCVLAAVSYGLFSVLNKRKGYDNYICMMVCHFAAFLVSTLFSVCSGNVLIPQLSQLPGLLWIGVGTSAIAYTAWALALSLGDTAKLSNLAYITPFLSLIWTALLLKEPVSLYSVLGLVVIVAGILLQIKEKKPGT